MSELSVTLDTRNSFLNGKFNEAVNLVTYPVSDTFRIYPTPVSVSDGQSGTRFFAQQNVRFTIEYDFWATNPVDFRKAQELVLRSAWRRSHGISQQMTAVLKGYGLTDRGGVSRAIDGELVSITDDANPGRPQLQMYDPLFLCRADVQMKQRISCGGIFTVKLIEDYTLTSLTCEPNGVNELPVPDPCRTAILGHIDNYPEAGLNDYRLGASAKGIIVRSPYISDFTAFRAASGAGRGRRTSYLSPNVMTWETPEGDALTFMAESYYGMLSNLRRLEFPHDGSGSTIDLKKISISVEIPATSPDNGLNMYPVFLQGNVLFGLLPPTDVTYGPGVHTLPYSGDPIEDHVLYPLYWFGAEYFYSRRTTGTGLTLGTTPGSPPIQVGVLFVQAAVQAGRVAAIRQVEIDMNAMGGLAVCLPPPPVPENPPVSPAGGQCPVFYRVVTTGNLNGVNVNQTNFLLGPLTFRIDRDFAGRYRESIVNVFNDSAADFAYIGPPYRTLTFTITPNNPLTPDSCGSTEPVFFVSPPAI